MTNTQGGPLFPLGRTLVTPRALAAMRRSGDTPGDFLERHRRGDWGETSPHDVQVNEYGLAEAYRIFSAYRLRDGTEIWVITKGDRSATTVLLPEDY